jgi:uncharacterized membrane protein
MTADPASSKRTGSPWTLAGWVIVVLSVAWTLVGMPVVGKVTPIPLFLLAIPFTIIHGYRRYGWTGIILYCVVAWVISNILENSSIIMGFPFGHYHYTFGPQIFHVPVMVGPAYVAIGYLSWQVASTLLGEADAKLDRRFGFIILPVCAAAIMTMFDLITDPTVSTLGKAWVWERGGAYYGVPLTNFLGWWFVTYLFFQVFAIFLRRRPSSIKPLPSRTDRLQPILLYFNLNLIVVVDFFISGTGSGSFVDKAGTAWDAQMMQEGMLTVFPFTVAFVTLLAISRLYGMVESAPER